MQLQIKFSSDWHIGSGGGIPGHVDRQVLRDHNGLPFIPAKTLTGILRDAAEFVAEQLDRLPGSAFPDHWSTVVVSVFGEQPDTHGGTSGASTQPAKLSIRPGRVPDAIRTWLITNKVYLDSLFYLQPGVKVSADSGRAEEDHLFFIEQVRSDCPLDAEITIDGDLTEREMALLNCAVLAVRRIGGKRRRGGGACRLSISGLPQPSHGTWLEWIKKAVFTAPNVQVMKPAAGKAEPDPAAANQQISRDTSSKGTGVPGKWRRVALILKTNTPIVVHRAVVGNVIESLDFIPGTLFLPYITRKLAAANFSDVFKSMASGRIAVTNFTLEVNDSLSRPAPYCFFHPKSKKEQLRNRLVEEQSDMTQLKGIRGGWIGMKGIGKGSLETTPKMETTHNTVQDLVQRPTEHVGGVYTYEAIGPHVKFRGELWLAPQLSELAIEKADFSGTVRLGRSKKDDYGEAQLSCTSVTDTDAPEIELMGGAGSKSTADKGEGADPTAAKKYLVVWLQSDVLLRDRFGSFSAHPQLLQEELENKLDVSLSPAGRNALGGTISRIGMTRRINSWQVKWGLPRPSLIGLQAGSIYAFEVTNPQNWDPKKAGELEFTGIGERRGEGFGRLALNNSLVTSALTFTRPPGATSKVDDGGEAGVANQSTDQNLSEPFFLLDPLKTFAHDLERHYWREEIRRVARRRAYGDDMLLGVGSSEWKSVSSSQWGSLRSVTPSISGFENAAKRTAMTWLGCSLQQDDTWRKDRWPDRREKAWGASRERLFNLFTDKDAVWKVLWSNETGIKSTLDGPGENSHTEALKTDLWDYAVRVLIDTACEFVFDRERTDRRDRANTSTEVPA